jgi:mannose-6-phosphate isomerase-like protein (cupin superfamily)
MDEHERLARAATMVVEFHLRQPYDARMRDKVDLAEALASFEEAFSPRIVAKMNDLKVTVAKTRGDFVWHKHEDTDDLFLVLKGRLRIQMRDRDDVVLDPGQLYVVPRGVEHCPSAEKEAHVLLIEPLGTSNTGDAGGDLTAEERWI